MITTRTQTSRVLMHSAANAAGVDAAAATVETYVQRGATANFVVHHAESLGDNGAALADAVLATCEADYNRLQEWFGNITIGNLPFNVYIKSGAVGGRHGNCLDTNLYCDAFNGTDADLVRWELVAEADEVFMFNQAAGWNCSASHGEALSRVLATEIYPNELAPPGLGGVTFASGGAWLDGGRADFVTNSEATDRNYVSIGCGTLFINWLRNQLGFSLSQIVQAGGATLAEIYQKLTGQTDGFQRFSDLLATHYPVDGASSGLTDDNPFPLT